MKIFIDHRLIQKLVNNEIDEEEITGLVGLLPDITLTWDSLFDYLGVHALFENYPEFNQDPFFKVIVSALERNENPEILVDLYDQLFAICLTEVKSLKQIDAAFLLEKIGMQKANSMFSESLDHYKKMLTHDPYRTIHGLILYFAFDRICIALSMLFEEREIKNRQGLEVLRDCLIESFKHIRAQGTANLSFFRLIEALYAYDMRDENLDNYADADWLTLCKGSEALRLREELIDVPYIDQALESEAVVVLTADSKEKVAASQNLCAYMIRAHNLSCTLHPIKVFWGQA